MKSYRLFILLFFLGTAVTAMSQSDDKKKLANGSLFAEKTDSGMAAAPQLTDIKKSRSKKDSAAPFNPRTATRRSALIPGWGQAYNKEYWKIPLVYGVLAIPVGLYFYNDSYYKKTKFAFEARFKEANGDTTDVPLIDPQLKNLSASSLQSYRNAFRRDRDYSILWFLLAWGLQVADATVFAHLKQFDVSNDLSMEVNPVFNPYTRTPGLGLSLNLKSAAKKTVIAR